MKLLHSAGNGLKRAACAAGRWIKRHKVLFVLAVVILTVGIFVGIKLLGANAQADKAVYSFVRTTTLTKGNLDDAVSATGTVGSANTSTVSYSAAGGVASPKIKTVNVAVGDAVKAGDVVVTLDSSDIQESITKEKESLTEKIADAQEKYDAALTAYNKAVSTATDYETTVANAKTALTAAQSAYESAAANVASFQSAYNAAYAAQEAAGREYNTRQSELLAAQSAYDAAAAAAAADPTNSELVAAADAANAALANAQAALAAAQSAYQTAETETQAKQAALTAAKAACNYDAYEKAYSAAQTGYTQSRSTLDQYEKTVNTCADTVTQTKKSLTSAATSDTLESLQESLEGCSLTAETDGKVTGLTASVGASPSGTIATIQDTDDLKISITIEESDINDVSVGMRCLITSDATDDTIEGILSQIDPVAGQSGSFGAEVKVTGNSSGLLIGMNATVQIVKNSTADCFMVPIDAVGEENGQSFVYRQTGGEGVDMTFEKVSVTTGASNDYYIEISGDDLAENDVIRSSADLTQGVEQTTEDTGSFDLSSMFGMSGAQSGMRPSGGAMPSGGEMPSGGAMPSGGPQG